MSTPIPFPSNAVTVLPDGVVAGSRKRKQVFSLNDPDNIEVARLATQAAKKKAKLSKLNSSEKKTNNQKSGSKSNRQPSIEEVEDVDNTRHRVFPRNPKNILESSDDDDEEATKKVTNLSKPTLSQRKKTNNKPAPKLNRQPSVEDVDDPADNSPCVLPCNPRNILESDEDDDDETSKFPATSQATSRATSRDVDGDEDGEEEVEVVEQPAESAEAELSE
jgi:hypothetical protein